MTARLGDGHWQASRAIQSEFLRQLPGASVDIVDYAQFLNRAFTSVVEFAYTAAIRRVPSLYGEFYRQTNRIHPRGLVQRRLNTMGHVALREALRRYRPDLVVCTYPTPGAVMSHLRQNGQTEVPIATVITDYTFHQQWLHPLSDMNFVGCQCLRDDLVAAGLRPERVYDTGIPIRPIFTQRLDRQEARRRLGLQPDLPTVLIMGGSCGVLPHAELIPRMLRESGHRLQAVAICGRNERLRSLFAAEAERYGAWLQVHGFVEHINEFMAAADLMVGKAGGLTITEALATHLPMLIHRPIVGQEAYNARFLAEAGAAMISHTAQELQWLLRQLIASPDRLSEMQAAAADLARPTAAADMVRIMLERLAQPVASHRS